MAKGISIGVAGDAREFTSAVKKGVIEPLEDADDAIKKLGRDGSLDDIERDMTDAQRATSKYEDELRDVIDQQKKAGRSARDFSDDAESGMHGAARYSGEFKDEARQNFSEVVSSFDGSMNSVADLAQGTLGGLASSIAGPIGLAAGVGAAALGGIFSGLAAQADAAAQKAEERISNMYQAFLESGKEYLTQDQIASNLKEIAGNTDDYKSAMDDAKASGLDLSLILRAQAGDSAALGGVLDVLKKQYSDAAATVNNATGAYDGQSQAASALLGRLGPLLGKYTDLNTQQDTAAGRARATRDALNDLGAGAGGASSKLDQLKGKLDGLHDINVKVNVDDAVAREHLRELGKAVNVDMFVTPKTGRGIN